MGKEVKSMNNVKVRTKLIIVMLAAFLAMTACVVFSTESMKAMQTKALETIESDKRASYDEMIQNQVDNVISLCQNIYTQYEAGVYTREEAKKLAEIIRQNEVQSITVVRMEVPCCGGLEMAAKRALEASGKRLPWQVITVGTDGTIRE